MTQNGSGDDVYILCCWIMPFINTSD